MKPPERSVENPYDSCLSGPSYSTHLSSSLGCTLTSPPLPRFLPIVLVNWSLKPLPLASAAAPLLSWAASAGAVTGSSVAMLRLLVVSTSSVACFCTCTTPAAICALLLNHSWSVASLLSNLPLQCCLVWKHHVSSMSCSDLTDRNADRRWCEILSLCSFGSCPGEPASGLTPWYQKDNVQP